MFSIILYFYMAPVTKERKKKRSYIGTSNVYNKNIKTANNIIQEKFQHCLNMI